MTIVQFMAAVGFFVLLMVVYVIGHVRGHNEALRFVNKELDGVAGKMREVSDMLGKKK